MGISHLDTNQPTINMLHLLLLVGLVSGFPGGDHHGDGHEENCVDISSYSEIQYNTSTADLCTFKVRRSCQTKTSPACVQIPIQECKAKAYPDCKSVPFTQVMKDDSSSEASFVPKDCFESDSQTLIEVHQKPVCETVEKEQCESKWVVNKLGEKVWAGNENCQVITWEDCKLVDVPHPIEVPTYTCTDLPAIHYSVPSFNEVEVTGYRTECQAAASAECQTNYVQCSDVEFEECQDIIEPLCFAQMMIQIPYQTYDHRLKCIQ